MKNEVRDDNILLMDPWVFEKLKSAVLSFPNQRALKYLVLGKDCETTMLHVANNEGASSSVMDWLSTKTCGLPSSFRQTYRMRSYTLDTISEREQINLADYDGLVLDTRGSELLVLKGSQRVLRNIRMVKVEVADFEALCRKSETRANCRLFRDL